MKAGRQGGREGGKEASKRDREEHEMTRDANLIFAGRLIGSEISPRVPLAMVTADGGVEKRGRRGTGGGARWRPGATCMVLGVIFGVSLLPTAAGIRYYFCDGGDMDTLSCQVCNPRPRSKSGILLHKHRLRV